MGDIQIRGLSKRFHPDAWALEGVDLDVATGELLVLVGPSGSGKTTLLRLLAGLDAPTSGTICLGGKDLAGMPPHQRNIALVFQNLALYSHLSVAENLAFGLKHARKSEGANTKIENRGGDRVTEVAQMLGIRHLLHRYPAELSGGEQQRVALGRAIVRRPAALLLDEPLSSLDGPMRRGLRQELKRLQRQIGVPTIYVTHDQAEALALADRVAVLDRGRIQQVGRPDEVYRRPANRFVGEFFGPQGINLIEGHLRREQSIEFQADTWQIELSEASANRLPAGVVLCGFRPEEAELGSDGSIRGEVESSESLGEATYIHIRSIPAGTNGQAPLVVRLKDKERPPVPGTPIACRLDPDKLHWFEPTSGKRL